MTNGSAESLRVAVATSPELQSVFFSPAAWARLCSSFAVTAADGPVTSPSSYGALLGSADVVVTAWGTPPLSGELLAGAPSLGLLAHTGASVKPFVSTDCWARGVRVTQAGMPMARSVADAALAHTLALLHRLHRFDHSMRDGTAWTVARTSVPERREIGRVRIGVVGASRTGRFYISRVLALGASVVVYDPFLSASEAALLGVSVVSLDELLRTSQLVALHAPILPETHHMIGRRELSLMPDGGLLVNTARAWLVDGAALLAELSSGRLDAALDVYDEEPLPLAHPLRSLPNVLLAPHTAGASLDARHDAGELLIDEISRYAAGLPLEHEISEDMLARMG
ncbi:hydroxyacid dehydrogenase [Tenggerimyces flavus]|uniref:Hydroxyacid dehydrogenase n=1 Tax=Tenggerimyces flavus TaxID=1708749 RepID=A0ABV7YBI7_9ACTN|nr:hydroxyacid dehydrogenase [Tenggerimyces flavus]MBM7787011.1 phosphoglycerate dehydrogenase-like enzyme [Tenggerimyces flavus]